MSPRETFSEAWRTIASHRGRALLTLFGVAWGTGGVIFLTSWGAGVQAMIERGYFRSGRNLVQVSAGRMRDEYSPATDRRYLWLTDADLAAVRRQARMPERIGGESATYLPVVFRQRARGLDVHGVEPVVYDLRGVKTLAGRALSEQDELQRHRVAVLGVTARERLLESGAGVGSWIRIDGKPFLVVGLLGRVGTQLARDSTAIDEQVWIPLSTFQTLWPEWWTQDQVVRWILFRVADRHRTLDAEREVRAILAKRLQVPPDDDEAVAMFSVVLALNKLGTDRVPGILFVIAITTLGVGGVGVLTLMLDAVHERRVEIGLRLALGARPRDVLRQFFCESIAITLLGGVIGVVAGVIGCLALAGIRMPDLVPLPILQLRIVLIALAVMTAIGLLAAIVPARRAMRVAPTVALRRE